MWDTIHQSWQNVCLLVLFWSTTVQSPTISTQLTKATLTYHQLHLHICERYPGIRSALTIFITCSLEISAPGSLSVCPSAEVSQHVDASFPVPPQQSQTPPTSSHSCCCYQILQYIKHRFHSTILTLHIFGCRQTKCVLFQNVRFDK